MKAAKLVETAREAAEVRTHQTDPNVVALNVERIRTWVNVFFWTGITLGLTFTMANVQSFASVGAEKFSIQWWIAWLLDPMVSLPLLGVLIGEQVLTRWNVKSGAWVHVVKWVTLSCTYAMNTWQAWEAKDPAKILLHSVPPLVVVCAAEGLTDLRHRITTAVTKAVESVSADASAGAPATPPVEVPVSAPAVPPVGAPVSTPASRLPERLSTASQATPESPAGPPVQAPAEPPADRPKRTRTATAKKPPKAKKLTPAEAREKAWELLKKDPDMSAPALAVELGKSPTSGHVRDMKAKLLREMQEAGELPSVRAIGA